MVSAVRDARRRVEKSGEGDGTGRDRDSDGDKKACRRKGKGKRDARVHRLAWVLGNRCDLSSGSPGEGDGVVRVNNAKEKRRRGGIYLKQRPEALRGEARGRRRDGDNHHGTAAALRARAAPGLSATETKRGDGAREAHCRPRGGPGPAIQRRPAGASARRPGRPGGPPADPRTPCEGDCPVQQRADAPRRFTSTSARR